MRIMNELKQIVVGVDGSDSSRAALQWAYEEAADLAPADLAIGPGVWVDASRRL